MSDTVVVQVASAWLKPNRHLERQLHTSVRVVLAHHVARQPDSSRSVTLRPFEPEDSDLMASISKRAFENDLNYGAPEVGGPPGYAHSEWQSRIAAEATAYLVIEDQGVAVGGIIVFGSSGHYWLGRMFVDPAVQNRGVGSRAMTLLEGEFPDAERWALETPPRNHHFYEKVGYIRTGLADSGDLLYEKHPRKTP
jgi:GNAT superfamily N-acetyltransferase